MDTEALIGTQLGNYVITRRLGEGVTGAVYAAEHPEHEREVAIRILAPELCQDAARVERFIAEARLRHPRLIEVHDVGRADEGLLYCVMELLEGRQLGEVIAARGAMSATEASPYIAQICEALESLHERGVVHRSLTPASVFVTDEGLQPQLKLLDVGLGALGEANRLVGPTASPSLVGPQTLAPEQVMAEAAAIGPQTDLYALGVILFWMLAGRPPFAGDAAEHVVASHVMKPPPRLAALDAEIPAAVADLVDLCLSKSPLDRPATAGEVAARLAGGTTSAPDVDDGPPNGGQIFAYEPVIARGEGRGRQGEFPVSVLAAALVAVALAATVIVLAI